MTQAERIELACLSLPSEKAKQIVRDLAAQFPEASIFWDEETAVILTDEVIITIESNKS